MNVSCGLRWCYFDATVAGGLASPCCSLAARCELFHTVFYTRSSTETSWILYGYFGVKYIKFMNSIVTALSM